LGENEFTREQTPIQGKRRHSGTPEGEANQKKRGEETPGRCYQSKEAGKWLWGPKVIPQIDEWKATLRKCHKTLSKMKGGIGGKKLGKLEDREDLTFGNEGVGEHAPIPGGGNGAGNHARGQPAVPRLEIRRVKRRPARPADSLTSTGQTLLCFLRGKNQLGKSYMPAKKPERKPVKRMKACVKPSFREPNGKPSRRF